VEIPGLGIVNKDRELDWYHSAPITVPVLGGRKCRIVVEGYDDDEDKAEFHEAIANFLSIDDSVLKAAEKYIHRYYKDCKKQLDDDDYQAVTIESPGDVWAHIRLGDEPVVSRRAYGDRGVYVSLSCGCDWEDEHGLQIVFKNGRTVNKVGFYDGHLTNSDARGDESLEDVIYPALND
jgi:hypothetical protein